MEGGTPIKNHSDTLKSDDLKWLNSELKIADLVEDGIKNGVKNDQRE